MIRTAYYRKTPTAEAIQVTENNMQVVAAWMNMKIEEMRETTYQCNAYECRVENGALVMQTHCGITTGRVGDWAVAQPGLLDFYTDKEFSDKFTLLEGHKGSQDRARKE